MRLLKLLVGLAAVAGVVYVALVGIMIAPFLIIQLGGALISAYLGYRILLLGWPGLRAGRMDLTTKSQLHGFSARCVGLIVSLLGVGMLVPMALIVYVWWTKT